MLPRGLACQNFKRRAVLVSKEAQRIVADVDA